MADVRLLVGNDQVLTADKVKDVETGDFLTGAAVTARILDLDGNEVSGQAWPLTLSFVAGSEGKYTGIIEDDVGLVVGEEYDVEVTVDAGADSKALFVERVPAVQRRF